MQPEGIGIAVLLDVVYNHFGPEGNYLPVYAPTFFTDRHETPWGAAINYDGQDAKPVREFVIRNALYWIEEFHLDGLRLDAVHAILDDSDKHMLVELAERVRASATRPLHLLLENEENDASRLLRIDGAPVHYTAQWNDDVHHVLHTAATHERTGYYADYEGNTEPLTRALAEGFSYQGQMMPYRGNPRGEPSAALPPGAFVAFIQNHDQIGNRAFGERLHAIASPEAIRALAATYLLLPQTPMIFMGEEWGAKQPFPFFCDFEGALADAVREGRRAEFAGFPEFQDPEQRDRIPDPLAESTFASAKLDWSALDLGRVAHYWALITARREFVVPLLPHITRGGSADCYGAEAVQVRWQAGARVLVLAANLSSHRVDFPEPHGRTIWSEGDTTPALGPWLDPGRLTAPRAPTPRATYRLQFHANFGFNDVAAISPYLGRLGISHVYASPYLKARPGSTHGYDITDHQALNPELGTEADFAAMVQAFQREGLGQILDFVPNHMGVGGADNPLWLDVLEWGSDSEHAGWFWESEGHYLLNKLLVPFLGDQYGVELKGGKLKLKYDDAEGTLAIWVYDTHKLPICPLYYDRVLAHDDPVLDRMSDLFSDLPIWRPQVAERARALKSELASLVRDNAASWAALDAQIDALNNDWQALDALIQEQNWRVAYYGVAGDEINYRRFFNINDLAGLRMELPAVFRHAHARIIPMIEDGTLDGIRLDHIDGLLDPKRYFDDLRAACSRPFYLVIEKILAAHEQLREDWPIEGTTGYDFTNLVLGAMINPTAEASFTDIYRRFTGLTAPFAQIVRECKIRIMDNEMASELNALGRDAGRVARQNPMTADFTRSILQRAIKQIVASFPVYRTYIDMDGAQEDADRRDLDSAMAQARRGDLTINSSVFDFLHRVLSGEVVAKPKSGFNRTAVLRFAMKLQQYSGPVMAKGLEDTAFYRYNRHVALNEVGGEPDRFGISANLFHKANASRAKNWPRAMLGTSTHDTKRGEDTRARLAVLSDVPEEWARSVNTWSRLLRARRGDIEGNGPPDRNDEYLLYQLLVGSWPVELLEETATASLETFGKRLAGALEKSMREAKLHSTWTSPDTVYEEAMQALARDALDSSGSGFLASFLPFAQKIARLGVQNSVIQTVMKLTLPGVPDIYQGCEMWDLSLVDPDNRRPVDYEIRAAALTELRGKLDNLGDRKTLLAGLLESWQDAKIKLAVTALLLDLRRMQEDLFDTGGYEALPIKGKKSERALGYFRSGGDGRVAVLVARFPGLRDLDPDWSGTTASLPEGRWTDWLTGRRYEGGAIDLASLFEILPAVVLRQSETF